MTTPDALAILDPGAANELAGPTVPLRILPELAVILDDSTVGDPSTMFGFFHNTLAAFLAEACVEEQLLRVWKPKPELPWQSANRWLGAVGRSRVPARLWNRLSFTGVDGRHFAGRTDPTRGWMRRRLLAEGVLGVESEATTAEFAEPMAPSERDVIPFHHLVAFLRLLIMIIRRLLRMLTRAAATALRQEGNEDHLQRRMTTSGPRMVRGPDTAGHFRPTGLRDVAHLVRALPLLPGVRLDQPLPT